MIAKIFVVLLTFVFSLCSAPLSAVENIYYNKLPVYLHARFDPILTKLENRIETAIKQKQIPGCAVAVVYKDQIIFLKGFGVKTMGRQDRITTDTVFQLGSVSKPIAATLAAVLEQKGLLGLDDPITEYLPDFALRGVKDKRSLKVKNLLNHSTGVPRAGFNNLIEAHNSYAHILGTIKKTPTRCPVGQRFDYHNAVFSLIAEVTMAATHNTFEDALSTNLLKPLNMTNTTSSYEGLLKCPNRATPHSRTPGKKGKLIPHDTYSRGYYNVAPAGGINSSIRDMALFLKAQLGGAQAVINSKMLSRLHKPTINAPNILKGYATTKKPVNNAAYGLGFRMADFAGEKIVFHGGWLRGFTNFIGFLPKQQVGIVILHNSESRFSTRLAMQFFDSFLHPKTFIPALQAKHDYDQPLEDWIPEQQPKTITPVVKPIAKSTVKPITKPQVKPTIKRSTIPKIQTIKPQKAANQPLRPIKQTMEIKVKPLPIPLLNQKPKVVIVNKSVVSKSAVKNKKT